MYVKHVSGYIFEELQDEINKATQELVALGQVIIDIKYTPCHYYDPERNGQMYDVLVSILYKEKSKV